MTEDATIQKSILCFLSQGDKKQIHQAALRILSEIGMQILHDEALTLLKNAGCTVEEDNIVKIPSALVENAVKTAPNNISVYDREGNPTMELGGYRSYFGTGSDLMYSVESEQFKRHRCSIDDVKRAARVCDALPNIDFIMSFAHPSEIAPGRSYLCSFMAMVEHSTKPIVCTAECRDDLSEMWEIARILRGSEEVLIEKPYFIHYAEPTSPLKHPPHSLEKLLLCAEKRIPVIYSPAPLAGSTAPMTIAGHVAQGLAESFCGLVIHQLTAEGAPFLMGMGAAILDMATSQSSYNAPEYYMAYLAMIEMSHYFDLPSWGYAGTSDSQIPDGQATFEAGLLTFMATMAGANLNHDVGYLNFGLTGSLEMIVITDEIISQIRRMKQGIPVNDETLALDAIREVGHTGHHLIHPHTLKHLRNVQWRPRLINRKGYEQWEKGGSLTLLDRARKTLHDILEKHKPVPIPEEKLQEIRRRVEKFKI
jgi:trimethylamine--corrinoid protein Co-methyltransferase